MSYTRGTCYFAVLQIGTFYRWHWKLYSQMCFMIGQMVKMCTF